MIQINYFITIPGRIDGFKLVSLLRCNIKAYIIVGLKDTLIHILYIYI